MIITIYKVRFRNRYFFNFSYKINAFNNINKIYFLNRVFRRFIPFFRKNIKINPRFPIKYIIIIYLYTSYYKFTFYNIITY